MSITNWNGYTIEQLEEMVRDYTNELERYYDKGSGDIYDWDKKEEYEENIRYWEQELENFSENS
tara:strand:+ start:10128 stop:10319 length:192 start_codon:yes stop_codon:yes gene_type:complete